MDSVLTTEQRKLVEELRSAFAASTDWVDADTDPACFPADSEVVHRDGCDCNALLPISKYDAGRERFMAAFAKLTDLPLRPADMGDGIYDEEQGLHACAPFCPTCRHRVVGEGRADFHDALVDAEGWHADKVPGNEDYEEACVDLSGWCATCDTEVSLYFCYGAEENCRKETACTTTGDQSDASSTTATTESPEPPLALRVATPEKSADGGGASSENGSNSDRGYVPLVGRDVP